MFYQKLFNEYIDKIFLPSIEIDDLRNNTKYILGGGKRYRAMILMDISYTIYKDYLLDLALAVELIHNASLILDDMPNMDNDNFRRNKESAHIKFGVYNAKIIAQFFLMKSIEIINKYTTEETKDIVVFILEEMQKACLGQYYDLKKEKIHNPEYYINLKTAPFFSIGFVLPLIYKKTNYNSTQLYILSNYFSMAFQICDDLEDVKKDGPESMNYISIYGLNKSKKDFNENLSNFKKKLIDLNLYSEFFDFLIKKLNNKYIENGNNI